MIEIKRRRIGEIPVLELAGTEYQDSARPLVVFYHGWTGRKENNLTQGYEFARQGVRVVMPDALYHGERTDEKGPLAHEAEFWQIIMQSVKEFPQVVAFYRNARLIQDNQIAVSGLSMGGITTCALLATYDWITTAGCFMGTPCAVDFLHYLLTHVPGMNQVSQEYVNAQVQALEKMDLSHHPERLAGRPVHFWHGLADETVPPQPTLDFIKQVQQTPAGRNVSVNTTPDAGHEVPYAATVIIAKQVATSLTK
ncbi:alpha/beta fold hydrolase [Ligilactobacillus sp. LYQ139]|uniref:alpha/beta fold hydrolase n=1 Tax=Ligilactobacillus sp. LYQ139 TaxID=3378800 RepID=UPI00386218D6